MPQTLAKVKSHAKKEKLLTQTRTWEARTSSETHLSSWVVYRPRVKNKNCRKGVNGQDESINNLDPVKALSELFKDGNMLKKGLYWYTTDMTLGFKKNKKKKNFDINPLIRPLKKSVTELCTVPSHLVWISWHYISAMGVSVLCRTGLSWHWSFQL